MDKEENKYGKYFRDLERDPVIQEFYKKSNFFEDRDLEIVKMKTEKEWFKFNWIKPSLDWYSSEPIVLKWNTYTYYKIERRFGPSWWLYGINFVEDPKYHGEETELGQISDLDLKKFIEWCKRENGGSKMINISAISGDFDIVEEIRRLYK